MVEMEMVFVLAACFCEKSLRNKKQQKVERRILKRGWLAIHSKIHV
jgi:hypothetical protein